MKWNKSTRLGLHAALEMAQARGQLVTTGGVAAKLAISPHHLAKVFQQLTRAGIATAVVGVGGGYRLAKNPKDVTLLDIVEVFEGRAAPERCMLSDVQEPCSVGDCRLRHVFDEIEQQAVFTLKSVRLSTLVDAETSPLGDASPRGKSPRR